MAVEELSLREEWKQQNVEYLTIASALLALCNRRNNRSVERRWACPCNTPLARGDCLSPRFGFEGAGFNSSFTRKAQEPKPRGFYAHFGAPGVSLLLSSSQRSQGSPSFQVQARNPQPRDRKP